MPRAVLIEPHYLPSLEFFCAVVSFDKIVLEAHQYYEKQSYRNRCFINTANGLHALAVPIVKQHSKMPIKEVRIDGKSRWQKIHWRTIQSAYAKAPFFEHYAHDLKKIIDHKQEFLFDLNSTLLSFCLNKLKLTIPISETVAYEKKVDEGISDLRTLITAKNQTKTSVYYSALPYTQVFGNAFVSNLSLIDLLFCAGPDSLRILNASHKVDLNK